MARQDDRPEGWLWSDEPEREPGRDKLGASKLARQIADRILQDTSADSYVIGVCGDWGTGKTTLLNFIEHFLTPGSGSSRPATPPLCSPRIVWLNPWWYESACDIVSAVFTEIGAQIARDTAPATKKVADTLDSFLQAMGRVARPLSSSAAEALEEGVRGPGLSVADAHTYLCHELARWGAGERPLGPAAGEKEDRRRLVVMVDDLDRLQPDEVVDVFRAVRAVGQLPYTTYILALDPQATTKALARRFGDEAQADSYLQKMLQVRVSAAPPRMQDLLSAVLTAAEVDPRWARDQGREAREREIRLGIMPFATNMRAWKTLLNGLKWAQGETHRDRDYETWLALRALEIFAPLAHREVLSRWEEIRAASVLLPDEFDYHGVVDKLNEVGEGRYPLAPSLEALGAIVPAPMIPALGRVLEGRDAIAKHFTPRLRPALDVLLGAMFPHLDEALAPPPSFEAVWGKDGAVWRTRRATQDEELSWLPPHLLADGTLA